MESEYAHKYFGTGNRRMQAYLDGLVKAGEGKLLKDDVECRCEAHDDYDHVRKYQIGQYPGSTISLSVGMNMKRGIDKKYDGFTLGISSGTEKDAKAVIRKLERMLK